MDMVTARVIEYSCMYITEEMGMILRNSAYSPNIRDRMDHSCAVFDAKGRLIAQAEHIPVHLGSMGIGVKNMLQNLAGIGFEDGDVFLTNDPYIAGTHLNDLLMITPILFKNELVAIVANKAHHVDVGGIVPGSISSKASTLNEEGIVIPPVRIAKSNVLNDDLLRLILSNVRTPEYMKGDIKAQLASLRLGKERIIDLIKKYGSDTVLNAWEYCIQGTRKSLQKKLEETENGVCSAEDFLEHEENRFRISVTVKINKESINVDFKGTDKQLSIPLNAVNGVTVASTIYAIKSVFTPSEPMNEGIYDVVNIEAPEGCLVNPIKPAPVAGGNIETSQRIVDAIFKALSNLIPDKIPAAAQGTMNNIMIGGRGWAFYETIGGGMGARPGLDGVDGIHVHMTNTMNTPIEVIEAEYPILFEEYSLRTNSGGAGKWRGGLGIRRKFRLLEDDAILTIFSERAQTKPWGLNRGEPGLPGEHYLIRNDRRIKLSSKTTVKLQKDDVIEINTPGGGGYGDPRERPLKLIIEDLKNGKITLEYALSKYPQLKHRINNLDNL